MPDREALLAALRKLVPDLRSRYGVASLAVFGSAARGDTRAGSDVDVLVTFSPGARVTLLTLASLTSQLEDALGTRVDVVEDHPRLRPEFRASIAKDLLRVA